jgi:mono/diheme cytochrome c family protein
MNLTLQGVLVWGAVLLFFTSSIGSVSSQSTGRANSVRQIKRVNELFNRNCARCHGADGRGDTPLGQVFNAPDFTDADWWQRNDTRTRTLISIVTRGKAGMPAFGKKLTKAEIGLLVARMRSFRK